MGRRVLLSQKTNLVEGLRMRRERWWCKGPNFVKFFLLWKRNHLTDNSFSSLRSDRSFQLPYFSSQLSFILIFCFCLFWHFLHVHELLVLFITVCAESLRSRCLSFYLQVDDWFPLQSSSENSITKKPSAGVFVWSYLLLAWRCRSAIHL